MNNEETIKNNIKDHELSIKSLKEELGAVENETPHNKFKDAYLKTMKACTNPFAKYNKDINSCLRDPKLYYLKKDIYKAEKFIKKILSLNKKTLKLTKVEKYLKALDKVQEPLLISNKEISEKLSIRQKGKLNKTLKALEVINEWLFDQKLILSIDSNEKKEETEDIEDIEKQAEDLIGSIGKNLEEIISKSQKEL